MIEVERLQRARDDHDVVGAAGDAGVALEFGGKEFAQGTIALRAAGKAIGRQRPALALEHGVDRLDQAVDRNLVGIVVAADETVFGKPGPPRGRRRQSGGQQGLRNRRGLRWTWTFTPVLFFVEKAAGLRLVRCSLVLDDPDRPSLADEGIMPGPDAADHQRLDRGLGDLAGADQSTTKLAPVPPRTSLAGMKTSTSRRALAPPAI